MSRVFMIAALMLGLGLTACGKKGPPEAPPASQEEQQKPATPTP